jgi:hypothetical protein
MNMNNQGLVIAVVVVLAVVAIAAWLWNRQQQSKRLVQRFGPEYERTVQEHGDRGKAEAELRAREKRVGKLKLVPLAPSDAQQFGRQWRELQARFVDNPKGVLLDADRLVRELMLQRGYPMGDFERRAADISVDHPSVVDHYRTAHGARDRRARPSGRGEHRGHAPGGRALPRAVRRITGGPRTGPGAGQPRHGGALMNEERKLSTADFAAAGDRREQPARSERRGGEPLELHGEARDTRDARADEMRAPPAERVMPQPPEQRGGEPQSQSQPSQGEQLAPLFLPHAAQQFRSQWDEVQIGFVDDPVSAVRRADELVAQVMQNLAQTFSEERSRLDGDMNEGDTEHMRVALRRYRSFFQRLLSL